MMFLHKMEHTPKLIPVIHLYSTLYSFVVILLQGATRKHVQFSRVIGLCKRGIGLCIDLLQNSEALLCIQ